MENRISFLVYDITGTIISWGHCQESTLQDQAIASLFAMQAETLGSSTQYVDLKTKTVATYTAEEQSFKDNLAQGWSWKMPERIVVDSRALADAQRSKINLLRNSCGQQILSGFDSNTLGEVHHYPAMPLDQTNLLGSVLASLLPGNPANWTTAFWCADSAGVWSLATHSAAQIQQVGADAKAAVLSATTKNDTLSKQVDACATIAQVDAIVW